MTEETKLLSDAELDRLLDHASAPPKLRGFTQRLEQRLAATAAPQAAPAYADNVIPFRRTVTAPATAPRSRFPALAALAASLLLGLIIGGNGQLASYLPGPSSTALVSQAQDTDLQSLDDGLSPDLGEQT